MSGTLNTLCPPELSQYSSDCARKVIRWAVADMKCNYIISVWSEDITQSAVQLAETYHRFTKKFYERILGEAQEKYAEHYALVHHFLPWAEKLSKETIKEAIATHDFCSSLCEQVFESSRDELRRLLRLQKLEKWATSEAAAVLDLGVSQYKRKIKRTEASSRNVDTQRNSDNACQSYAHSLVEGLFSSLKVQELTSIAISNSLSSDKSKSSHCGSCESITSDLLSPHSSADSSGLHHFADKLLYSLSALENRSTESISSTDTTDCKYSIVDCLRRSSAPELRVSSRKSSLKTVFEEMPAECGGAPVMSARKLYPCTSLGRRLRCSDERRCASMESIDGTPTRSSYSETLAKNILFSAYKDFM